MRLLSYLDTITHDSRAAVLDGEWVVEVASIFHPPLPPADTMLSVLRQASQLAGPDEPPLQWLQRAWDAAREAGRGRRHRLSEVTLVAPLPNPTSLRDFYAFEQHVRTARAQRGLDVVPEWYQMPVFYFSNHQAIVGPGADVQRPAHTQWLDFELEIAAIIGREGRNIVAEEGERYIAGYTVMNDWSARDVQRQEMKVGLGPAKGKDFATSLGPWLVTPDELADCRAEKGYALTMVARRNGIELSRGSWQTIHFSFGEMIARASQDVTLFPGDVIGSGTVGTGCLLELGAEAEGGWLQPGELVELEIERLGTLRNRIA